MYILSPYQSCDTWVFDDESTGLQQEPFVMGMDKIISRLVSAIPDAESGFQLIFSSEQFPRYNIKLEWLYPECGGNWYNCPEYNMQGWLCPALYKYFEKAPRKIYFRAEPKNP